MFILDIELSAPNKFYTEPPIQVYKAMEVLAGFEQVAWNRYGEPIILTSTSNPIFWVNL